MYYLLNENKEPYKVSIEEGLKIYDDPEMKIVQQDRIDDVFVSTVFLGMDHGWNIDKDVNYKPVLWETMIFGGEHDQYQERYTSYKDALRGHFAVLSLVQRPKTTEDDDPMPSDWKYEDKLPF